MAEINSKERTFADELCQRFNSDQSDRSLIPKRLGMIKSDENYKKS